MIEMHKKSKQTRIFIYFDQKHRIYTIILGKNAAIVQHTQNETANFDNANVN